MTMTSINHNVAGKTSVTGESTNVAVSEIFGVIGGVLGGVIVYAETGNVTAGIVGAAAGGLGGYGMGNMVAPICNQSGAGGKILSSTLAVAFGVSCAGLGGAIGEALTKLGGNQPSQ